MKRLRAFTQAEEKDLGGVEKELHDFFAAAGPEWGLPEPEKCVWQLFLVLASAMARLRDAIRRNEAFVEEEDGTAVSLREKPVPFIQRVVPVAFDRETGTVEFHNPEFDKSLLPLMRFLTHDVVFHFGEDEEPHFLRPSPAAEYYQKLTPDQRLQATVPLNADTYFGFRVFVNPGDLDWDPSLVPKDLRQRWEIGNLIAKLLTFTMEVGKHNYNVSPGLTLFPLTTSKTDSGEESAFYQLSPDLWTELEPDDYKDLSPDELVHAMDERPPIFGIATWPDEDVDRMWSHMFDLLEYEESKSTALVEPPRAAQKYVKARRTIGVSFGPTIAPRAALEIVQAAGRIRFPKKWGRIPRWENLVQQEIERLNDEEGVRAFEDLRRKTGNREERGPLLKKRYTKHKEEIVGLTKEAEGELRLTLGHRPFIELDKTGQERLVKRYDLPKGKTLQIGLSWQGLAGPLVDEWRKEFRERTEERREEALKRGVQLNLLGLEDNQLDRLDRMMDQIRLWEDGRRMMEVIISQVGKQQHNPVEIPAVTFQALLWPDRFRENDLPANWKSRIETALSSLHALTFHYEAPKVRGLKGYGGFLGEWQYVGIREGAQGRHGGGVYILDVQSGFLGCLDIFTSGRRTLKSGLGAVTYEFGRLTADERKALGDKGGYVQIPDAGRAFYNAADKLSSEEEALVSWMEHNLTRRSDTASKRNRGAQVPKTAGDAEEYRVYTRAFCPLLPEGREYFGALGRYRRNAEYGVKLIGTESPTSRHSGGLLEEMGYTLPSGRARSRRAKVIQAALDTIGSLVEVRLEGVAAIYCGDEWLTLNEVRQLDMASLRKARFFLFLPTDYQARRRLAWEELTGRRATDDPTEAEQDAWEDPLPGQLQAALVQRKTSQRQAARLFGVSQQAVNTWVTGKKPVPGELVPYVSRWIATGQPPAKAELARRKTRRSGRNGQG